MGRVLTFTIFKIIIDDGWRIWRWKPDISTSKNASLADPDLALTTRLTKWLVEKPSLATVQLKRWPLTDPLHDDRVPNTVRNVDVGKHQVTLSWAEIIAKGNPTTSYLSTPEKTAYFFLLYCIPFKHLQSTFSIIMMLSVIMSKCFQSVISKIKHSKLKESPEAGVCMLTSIIMYSDFCAFWVLKRSPESRRVLNISWISVRWSCFKTRS